MSLRLRTALIAHLGTYRPFLTCEAPGTVMNYKHRKRELIESAKFTDVHAWSEGIGCTLVSIVNSNFEG